MIASKVSLVAYEEFAVTENEAERTAEGTRHIENCGGGFASRSYFFASPTSMRRPSGSRM